MSNLDPSQWFAAARIKACNLMPYFSAAVMGLVPYRVEGYGTLGVTDRGVLVWDPALHKKWTVEQLAWVLLHEALHYLRTHGERCKAMAADPKKWNLAADAEINDDLRDAGAAFPPFTKDDVDDPALVGKPSGVLPHHLGCEDGQLAEVYYHALRAQKAPGGQGSGKGSGSGKGEGKGGGDTPPTLLKEGCGSGAGNPLPGEEKVPAELGKSRAEQKRIARQVAEAVRAAVSKSRGRVPLSIQRWADEVLGPPHVRWQDKLARACRRAVAYRPGAGDYRYDRPSRRQSVFGYGTGSPVFPALRRPVPRVAVIIDTSGSMGEGELKTGLEETRGILAAVGADIDFVACDAEVHTARAVRNIREAVASLKGGGGTDMRPAFAAVRKMRSCPDVIVCVTDGHIGDPGPQPVGARVIWLVCGAGRSTRSLTWGEVVEIDA